MSSNSTLQARALIREYQIRHMVAPAALYVGQADFMDMAHDGGDNPGSEFTPPYFLGARATFRGVPVYHVDEDRHMAVRG